jgi:hypothetical protein
MDLRSSQQDWRLIHVLVIWSAVSVVLAIGLSGIYPTPDNPSTEWMAALPPLELMLRIAVGLGAIPAIWLWLRMAGDYLRQRSSKHRLVWGAAIFMGLYLGALLYFWAIWRPRVRPTLAAYAANTSLERTREG